MSDYTWGLEWRLDLLTTLTHDMWLHLIITSSPFSTLYKSLQHKLSLFRLLCSSIAVHELVVVGTCLFHGRYLVTSLHATLLLWHLWLISPSFPLARFSGDYSPTTPAAPFLRPLVPSTSLIRCQSVQVYYHHPCFGRRGQKFWERPMLLHLQLLPVCSLFICFRGGRPLHNVQSLIFCSSMENSTAHFATSSPKVFLTVLLNASCFLDVAAPLNLSPLFHCCLLSSVRPSGTPLATLSLHGPWRPCPLCGAGVARRVIIPLQAAANFFQDPPSSWVHFFSYRWCPMARCWSP
jgi:hypothetical protein